MHGAATMWYRDVHVPFKRSPHSIAIARLCTFPASHELDLPSIEPDTLANQRLFWKGERFLGAWHRHKAATLSWFLSHDSFCLEPGRLVDRRVLYQQKSSLNILDFWAR